MNVLTSFMFVRAEEGPRLAYTYSVLSETGEITAQNQRGNFVVMDEELQAHLDAVCEALKARIG